MRVHIIILLLIGLLTSCCTKQQSYPEAMIQAEACIVASPDSALTLLSTLEEEIKDEPRETQMYYNLLTIKAQDKLYIPHTSDSLIKVITEFYENYGDSEKLMEAYYYLGSTYRDMKDAPQALKAFQNVVDVGKDSRRYDVLAQTYGQMGTLFTYQRLEQEALQSNQKALYYHTKLNNIPKVSLTSQAIARIYDLRKLKDSTLYYYNASYKWALKSRNKNRINNVLSELGCYYYDLGKKDTAKNILLRLAHENNKMTNVLLQLGIIYQDLNQKDSALYYFNQTIQLGDIYKQSYAYYYLSQMEAKNKNYRTALKYAYKYQELNDSIDSITQTEAVTKIQYLYNYQNIEKENDQLKINNEKQKVLVYQLLFILGIVSTASIFVIFHFKKKKKASLEQERKIHKFKEEQYSKSLDSIKRNKEKIHDLEAKLKIAEKENDSLNKQLIEYQKELLELSNSQIIAAHNEQSLLKSSFVQSDIYILFHKAGNDDTIKIKEANWKELQKEIDKTYNNFTNKLYSLYPRISILELHICYLIKISMQVKGIAKLVNRSKPAISAARIRLYKKIHGEEGTVEMLDQFIIDL